MYLWNKIGKCGKALKLKPFISTLQAFYTTILLYFPLTLPGSLTLVLSLYLLISGLSTLNAYEVVLGAFLFLLLGILVGIGFAIRRNAISILPSWEVPETIGATLDPAKGPYHRIAGLPSTPLFFRILFETKGSLQIGNEKVAFYREVWAAKVGEIKGQIQFSLSGQFHGSGYRTVRDLFGLVRIHIPPTLHRRFPVLPAPTSKQALLRLDPSLGQEEKRNPREALEERYFMREYVPGDRFRDINWKTSSRLSLLVTRIAPQSQEKTRILPVAFRALGPSNPDIVALWTLDRAKAWLVLFLRTVRKNHPEYILRVITPQDTFELATDPEVQSFSAEVAHLAYHSPDREERFSFLLTAPEEVFVFSTDYDRGLPRFIGGRTDLPTQLYLTKPQRRLWQNSGDSYSLRRSFQGGGILSHRVFWPLPLPPNHSIRPSRGQLDLQSAEVTL